ncbi:hypothetical protein [Amycolatopsis methanolica]|uniref:Serine protease n=1 Tax=Amycolatopsis methanolica 239 TaxID=1068978 RepID=A0A076MTS4_AMYME|nr:hypothetical protein [Amycolatopsis methanolica]AIJ24343.1 hypothetical protein AMETH_4251 [Amycolatopsis methanolica 239]
MDDQQAAAEQLMSPELPPSNVVGVGLGVKWRGGVPTGEAAAVVMVTQKIPREDLPERDLVPDEIAGLQTDVYSVGDLIAQRSGVAPSAGVEDLATMLEGYRNGRGATMERPIAEAAPQLLTRRMRPCPSGASVGNVSVTAGTLGSVVYDFLPQATINPPVSGIGTPARFYILSNNHVLANTNAAPAGSAIVQPGTFDGGTDPQDRIATLSRFVPLQLEPFIPRALHRNIVDAAVAECNFGDATREIYFTGAPRGWVRKGGIRAGDLVRKTGRTTNFTVGRVTVTNATVDVNYGGGRVGRFLNQIITTGMSAGGDSGSLVCDLDNNAVGLLFAGSTQVTICNHFEDVRTLLRVEVAERILLQPAR